MKRIICGSLAAALLLASVGAASAQSGLGDAADAGQTLGAQLVQLLLDAGEPSSSAAPSAQSGLGDDADAGRTPGAQLVQLLLEAGESSPSEASPSVYVLGVDELPSIPAIVGEREGTALARSDTEQEYSYKSASVRDDLLAYIDRLGESGFEVVRGAPLDQPGEGELTAASQEAGKQISVRLDWTLDGYRVHLSLLDGTPPEEPAENVEINQGSALSSAGVAVPSSAWEALFLGVTEALSLPVHAPFAVTEIPEYEPAFRFEHVLYIGDAMRLTYYDDGADAFNSAVLAIDLSGAGAGLSEQEALSVLSVAILAGDPEATSEEIGELLNVLCPALRDVLSGAQRLSGLQTATLNGIGYGLELNDDARSLRLFTNAVLEESGAQ